MGEKTSTLHIVVLVMWRSGIGKTPDRVTADGHQQMEDLEKESEEDTPEMKLLVATERALEFRHVKKEYDRAWRILQGAVTVMSDQVFWPLVDKLRAQMMKKGNMTPDNWLSQCVDAEKAYRELVVAERETVLHWVSFHNTWRGKSREWSKLITAKADPEKSSHRGDDAWGDFLDALPLLGWDLYLYVEQLEDKTLDETKFRKRVGTYLLAKLSPVEESLDKTMAQAKGIEILVKDIFEGENYILSSIDDYNQKRFLYDAEDPASE